MEPATLLKMNGIVSTNSPNSVRIGFKTIAFSQLPSKPKYFDMALKIMAVTNQFNFTDYQNITIIPTLKFFKHGSKSSVIFDNIHLAKHGNSWNKAMKNLFAFIDQQMGRISIKVHDYFSQVIGSSSNSSHAMPL